MWKRIWSWGTIAALAAALVGCAGASSERPAVAASFYPMAWIAERIVGEDATVTNLTNPGQEPHDLELTVQQTAQLAKADVVIYEKGLQPSVDDAVANAGGRVVEATEFVSLTDAPDGSGKDPHVWLDPTQMAKIAAGFTAQMAKADPDNAQRYRDRLDSLQRQLADLDRDLRKGLAKCETRTVVVSHDAFGYFGRRYDLTIVPIAGISPDAEPSAKQLAAIAKVAERAKVTTVFSETLASPALAQTLASQLGVTTAVLDPLEGVAEGKDEDYFALMKANLLALQKANRCS